MRLRGLPGNRFGALWHLGCFSESRVRAYASAVQDFYVPSADLCMVGKIYMPTTNCFFSISKFLHEPVKADRIHTSPLSSHSDHSCLKRLERVCSAVGALLFNRDPPRKPFAALDEPQVIALLKTQEEYRHSRMLGL